MATPLQHIDKNENNSYKKSLSKETIDFIDHIAEILAQEFVEAMKQEESKNESSDLF